MDKTFDILNEELPASFFVHLLRDEKISPFVVSRIFKKHIDNCFDNDKIYFVE